MGIRKAITAATALALATLCGCSNIMVAPNNSDNSVDNESSVSEYIEDFESQENESNSNGSAIFDENVFAEDGEESYASYSPDNTDNEPQADIDYYKYYDPINNRSNMNDDGVIYLSDDYFKLNIIDLNPTSMRMPITTVKEVELNRASQNQFVLGDYLFYYTYNYTAGGYYTAGLNKYDLLTGEVSEVVPSYLQENLNLSSGQFVLSNNNKIYGMIPTWHKEVYTDSSGELDVMNVGQCNLIVINETYSGYTIIQSLDSNYNYTLKGVYDGIAYLSKSEKVIYGEEFGLFAVNLSDGTERKVFDRFVSSYGLYSTNYSSQYNVIELNGELCFLYVSQDNDGYYHLYLYRESTGWKDIFSSKNYIDDYFGGVQLINDKIYVTLNNGICYEFTEDSQTYIGIGYCPIIYNPITEELLYYSPNKNKIQEFE